MRDNLKTPNRRATRLKLLFVLFLLLPGFTRTYSQSVISPGTTETPFATYIQFSPSTLNNALVDYHCNGGGQLIAAVWDQSGSVNCGVSDGTNAFRYSINIPSYPGYIFFDAPDIILAGDNSTSPASTTFYGAIVYTAYDNSGHSDIFMDVFTITDPGSIFFAGTGSCGSPILLNSSPHTNSNTNPHIDVIAKDMSGGIVNADNFVVSWDQYDGTTNDVMGLYCSGLAAIASSCTISNTPVNIASVAGLAGAQSDVAGIEKYDAVSGMVHDMALFTYIAPSLTTPSVPTAYYQEWDVTTTPSSTATAIYSSGNMLTSPRIDAIDCYTQHDPFVTGIADYDIVLEDVSPPLPPPFPPTPPIANIVSYNDRAGAYNCTNGYFNSAYSSSPQVACGPGSQYSMVYTSQGSGSLPNANIYSQLIDWSSGNLTPNNNTYLQVNMNTGVTVGSRSAISSAVNNLVPDYIFTCWYNATFPGEIDYKTSPSPVAYKSTSVSSVPTASDWQLSPNPATDYVYLSCTGNDISGTTYSITDITGRVLQQAAVTSMRQQVGIGELPPGMYMMNVGTISPDPSKGGERCVKTIKFVKE